MRYELEGGFEAELKAELEQITCASRLRTTRVAVVGAGLAGLLAARRLGQEGINVTIFEARSQVGGRVLSNETFSKGRITEEGAELIASFHTKWLTLAREYGLTVVSRMNEDFYNKAGLHQKWTLDKPLSRKEIEELEGQEVEVLTKIAINAASWIADPNQPWRQPGLQKYDQMSVADALDRIYHVHRRGRLWKALQFLMVNDEVAPLEKMNFLGLLCKVKAGQMGTLDDPHGRDPENVVRYWTELEIFRSAEGCQKLATKIAAEIRSRYRADLRLKTAVTNIQLAKEGVKLGLKTPLPAGKLRPGPPERIFAADYVILAIPPSVWGGVTITAEGKKAQPEVEIGQIGMGPAVKFFSDCRERFWIKEKAAPYGGTLKLGQVWEGTDNQTKVGDQGIVLSVFAGPIIDGTGGPRAPTQGEMETGLKRLYRTYGSNVKNTLYTNWPQIPFIKTGYASPTVGQIFKIGDKLTKPFHGRLFFAGEHTDMGNFGYMEGALRSGERAAESVIQRVCGEPRVVKAA